METAKGWRASDIARRLTTMHKVLNSIANDIEKRNLVVFIGAGISIDGPTSLPGAADLTNTILAAVCSVQRELQELIFPNPAELRPSALLAPFWKIEQERFSIKRPEDLKSSLRLEVVLELLFEAFGTHGLECLTFMKSRTPNHHHTFVARLHTMGCQVLTTNFDTAVEEVVHLHGCITEPLDRLGATVSSLENGLSLSTIQLLEKLLSNKHVLFLGYSGSDHFDISPFLMRSNRLIRKVTWVSHEHGTVFPLVIPAQSADQYLDKYGRIPFHSRLLRQVNHGHLVMVDTNEFRRSLEKTLWGHAEPTTKSVNFNWQKHVNKWGESLAPSLAASAIGKLAQQIGLADTARACYKFMRSASGYTALPDAKRTELELNEEYILSLTGRYASRYAYLKSHHQKLRENKAALGLEWKFIELLYRKKLASCMVFNDRMLPAFGYMISAIFFGLITLGRRSPSITQPTQTHQRMRREIHEIDTDINFMLRIYPRRWFFSCTPHILHRIMLVQGAFMRFIRLFLNQDGMANKVRSFQYEGRLGLHEILGASSYYFELENLLGVTNALRETALRSILSLRLQNQHPSKEQLSNAEAMLETSAFISKQISDNPGAAKAYHHLSWIAMMSRDGELFEERAAACGVYLKRIEAPRWVLQRQQDLVNWGTLLKTR